jgi:hypothetical protein
MEFRLDRPEAAQCVECGQFRHGSGWSHEPPVHGLVISHTICPSCQPGMLDDLRWDIEFPTWSMEKQMEAIRLRVRHIPMDAATVRDKLRSVGVDDGATLLRFMEEVRPFLVERLCHYCRLPIEPTDPVSQRAGYLLHESCAEQLSGSMQVLVEMDPPHSHLDAYMDVARIPHGVRAGVRKGIESSFMDA